MWHFQLTGAIQQRSVRAGTTQFGQITTFVVAAGLDPGKAANAGAAIDTQTNILTPAQDAAILREAGFSNVSLFYAAFSFRGWVAYA